MLGMLLFLMLSDHVWGPTDDPNQKALFENGRQIGVVDILTGNYLRFDGRNFISAPAPVPIPPEMGGPKPDLPSVDTQASKPADKEAKPPGKGCTNYGLFKEEITQGPEYFSYNGAPIDKGAAEDLLAGAKKSPDTLQDDSAALRLTIIGGPARDKAAKEIQENPDWETLGAGVLVKAYAPDSWTIRGKGYTATGTGPTYYLTEPDGTILYAGEDAGGVLDALRRKRNPNPLAINWNSWNVGVNPFTWMVGLGFSNFHLPAEFVLAIIAAIVVAVLILRRPAAPPIKPG